MKVWTASIGFTDRCTYYDYVYIGIYSTREKATEALTRHPDAKDKSEDDLHVDEVEIDKDWF